MNNEMQIAYYFIPNSSFSIELRIYRKNEKYPIYKNEDYFILMAENGEFNLTEKALNETIADWSAHIGRFEALGDGNDD
ncbi:hypothetical protein LFAB_09160 [Lactiplantibacillus fabifermentans T30PCM01]|uniref:Uncharacterized protein n=1 Tax=Lactiplantibacillus fabifermentans T30PCM01 TaxID=1400520 RepID=W6T753_9LACO|nr:hypothetical protein [Lactiplantibacillus fabifermentans]ETY74086.1 hypothetical protein LFAB_09160 [Lactiplantibacillus fabifermentans T30PCM01]